MKIALICRSFDKNSGQGIYKMAGYLYENLKKYSNFQIVKIESEQKNPYYFDLIECPKKVLKSNFDVYHFLMPEVCLPLFFSKELREKSFVTIHDTIVYKIKERRWFSEKYIKLMYDIAKKAKFIHTPSWQSKKDVSKLLKLTNKKIFVVPWGVDLNFFRPLKTKREIKTVGYIGGLGRRKNIEWILYLAKEFKDLKFKIAGKGPNLNKLKKMKKRMKLNNVIFLGFIPEEKLIKFYNSINIFIFPSLEEGFGIPLVEAMACEVPYIISMNTGIAKILPIYKLSNFKELKDTLTKIKNNEISSLENQRKWLIKNGLTWENHVKQLVKIYEKI